MRILKQKFPKFIDINTFDFTPYGIEGVGFVAESIKQGYFVDEKNQLSVTNCGSFSQRNNVTYVDK